MPRYISVIGIAIALAGCVDSGPGCGFSTTDASLMTMVKNEMTRQGIAFKERPNGMVECSSADGERFHALLQDVQGKYMHQTAENRVGRVAILADSPDHAACISAELARRQIPFSADTLAGKQSIEWKPENEDQKEAVLAACKRER